MDCRSLFVERLSRRNFQTPKLFSYRLIGRFKGKIEFFPGRETPEEFVSALQSPPNLGDGERILKRRQVEFLQPRGEINETRRCKLLALGSTDQVDRTVVSTLCYRSRTL
ncbi:hypothetical protein K0M31_016456 [Melipona bicolor]|uniref:Uncharacterized protein n=1 Tax=Melipona bicolor TaxID=60889 RepID=A0AA40G7X1_9HYME|nr:hypothetical protein K0M31_016456 [Melipona bicolor]